MPKRSSGLGLDRLGERGLVARLRGLLPPDPAWVRVGAGADDTAVLDLGGRKLTILTCDVQVEGQHFERRWTRPRVLGRRAASVNLSDVAAMGGTPKAALASLVLPRDLTVRFFDEVLRGLGEGLAEHGAALVGGNLARSKRHIVVDVTLVGEVRRDRLVRRQGARPGDRILVTGWPGESAAGLSLLRNRTGRARLGRLVQRHLDPTPRVAEAVRLAAGGVTSMIDISDGLAADLHQLCDASTVDAEIEAERLPVSAALEKAARVFRSAPRRWVLQGGEDYELLCTAPARRLPALRRALDRVSGLQLTDIGRVLPAGQGRWLLEGGQRLRLAASGYQHFGSP